MVGVIATDGLQVIVEPKIPLARFSLSPFAVRLNLLRGRRYGIWSAYGTCGMLEKLLRGGVAVLDALSITAALITPLRFAGFRSAISLLRLPA
jgi:hypothetical protein